MRVNIGKLVMNVKKELRKHGPEILIWVGTAGLLTTTFVAVKETPKAIKKIEKRKKELGTNNISKMETAKTVLPCYVPAIITGTLSVTCIASANKMNVKRNAALIAAYALSEKNLKEYKDKVIETIGDKKEKAIVDSIAKDHLDKNPVEKSEIVLTEKGDTLCYDSLSGRYFKSNIDKIRKAEMEINREMRSDIWVSLNDFYYELGIPEIEIGNEIGWHIDQDYLTIDFSSCLATDGTPCLVLNYNYYGPREKFQYLM